MDLEIRKLSSKLVEVLNEANTIPIEVKRYIVKDIYDKLEKLANDIISQEIQIINEQNKQADKPAEDEGATEV